MNTEIKLALLRTLPFWIVIAIIFFLIKRKKINSVELDLRKPISVNSYLLWIFAFLGLIIIEELLLNNFNLLEVSHWNHTFFPSIILIVGAVIIAPIAEELMFRGLILNVLRKKKINLHVSIVIQTIIFVALHNFTYQNTMSSNIGIVQSFADGMLFAYARIYTKSLLTPITMHIFGNAIAILERFIL